MRWAAYQYAAVWDSTYANCDSATQEMLDRRLDLLREKGVLCGRPISAPLADGIFELRANAARMLFIFGTRRDIIFVNCFTKKVRRVPPHEIALAKKRRAEISRGEVIPNALPN